MFKRKEVKEYEAIARQMVDMNNVNIQWSASELEQSLIVKTKVDDIDFQNTVIP
jgi:fibronectin type 3 domain-containing protein